MPSSLDLQIFLFIKTNIQVGNLPLGIYGGNIIYKSYDLSDSYRLYISCKNNIGKALNYQIDLSDWCQLYITGVLGLMGNWD